MKASSVSDVIAGEAVGGSDTERLADMIGVYSTMVNRASMYGQTIDDVVKDQSQFNAYGKNMPKGTDSAKIQGLVQKAMSFVDKHGPQVAATHYATPSAAKNIKGWSGFKQVDQSIGHVFAVDPQASPIKTKNGVVHALPHAIQNVLDTVRAANQKAMSAIGAATSDLADAARETFHLGAHRPNKPSEALRDAVRTAVGSAVPGGTADYISGMGEYGSPRHRQGMAADIDAYDAFGNKVKGLGDYQQADFTDRMAKPAPSMQDVAMTFAAQNPNRAGIGLGVGYMSGNEMSRAHLDISGLGKTWGKDGRVANASPALRQNIENAKEMGRFSDEAAATRPGMAPGHLPGGPAQVARAALGPAADNPANASFAAPVGSVSRSPLGPVGPDKARFAGPAQAPQVGALGQGAATPGMGLTAQGANPPASVPNGPIGYMAATPGMGNAVADAMGVSPTTGVPTVNHPPNPQVGVPAAPPVTSALAKAAEIAAPTIAPEQQAPAQQPAQQTVAAPQQQVHRQQQIQRPAAQHVEAPSLSQALGLGGLFGFSPHNVGTGLDAIGSVLGRAAAGSTAFSRADPRMSVTSINPNTGLVATTNQFGVTTYSRDGNVVAGPGTGLFSGLFGTGGLFGHSSASGISPAASRATGGGTHAPSGGGLY